VELELVGRTDGDEVRSSLLSLAERFRPDRARGLRADVLLELTDHGQVTFHLRDGRCAVSPGHPAGRPSATLTATSATWLELVSGEVDGIAAFTAGRLRVHGDLDVAARFETLFGPGPRATRHLAYAETRVGSVDVAAVIAGSGPPVLLLHGLGASKVSFLPTLDGLADRYEVHALDLPGFGASSAPLPTGRRYGVPWFADVVRGYLDARGMDAVALVGNSMGGRIGLEVALRAPTRVRGVVGLCPAVGFEELRGLAPLLRVTRPQWAGVAPMPVPAVTVERFVRSLFHEPSRVPADNHRAAADEVVLALRDPRRRLALLAAARHLATSPSAGRRGYWARLRGTTVPTAWIFGARDRLVPVRYAQRVREALPTAQVEVWDDVGHVPQFEVPDRTTAAVGGFLDQLAWRDGRGSAPRSSQSVTTLR
jgi:pimeloyl-ACP methyl ester carboxylesterase/putative sterol carrier protein